MVQRVLPQVRYGSPLAPKWDVKRVKEGKEVVQWSFGVGEEGLKPATKFEDNVIIIDSIYPCWLSAAKSVGLSISKIWLLSLDTFPLEYLRTLTGNTVVNLGPIVPSDFWEEVARCQWILVGDSFPSLINDKRIWTSASLQRIVVLKNPRFKLPVEWHVERYRIKHSEVGGVTDSIHNVVSLSRWTNNSSMKIDKTPGQDLRSILKSGEPGVRTFNVPRPASIDASEVVKFSGHGTITEDSLWPVKYPHIKVHTKYRNMYWIERPLVNFEIQIGRAHV